jgi:hypothetical protein
MSNIFDVFYQFVKFNDYFCMYDTILEIVMCKSNHKIICDKIKTISVPNKNLVTLYINIKQNDMKKCSNTIKDLVKDSMIDIKLKKDLICIIGFIEINKNI